MSEIGKKLPSVYVDLKVLRPLLMGDKSTMGLFEEAVGLKTSTYSIKGVHIMNDLAQTVLGGVPTHRGDFLCRVLRETAKKEANSDTSLRTDPHLSEPYSSAYPPGLPLSTVSSLRAGAASVLNFDKGIYAPGTSMASGLATHRDLLGAEGFTRLGLGPYLANLLGPDGQARVRALYEDASDPISRAFAPLRWDTGLTDLTDRRPQESLTPLDKALSQRLQVLLQHRLTKPTLLRYLLLMSTLGLCLRVLGLGNQAGRPTLVAAGVDCATGQKPARAEAVQTFRRGVASLDGYLSELLVKRPDAEKLWTKERSVDTNPLKVEAATDRLELARNTLRAARNHVSTKNRGSKADSLYWPDAFISALGRKLGLILPKKKNAGWGEHLTLTSDGLEALILMYCPPETGPRPWHKVWRDIAVELGLIIGANEHEDRLQLGDAGVVHVDLQSLEQNSEVALKEACRRGVARRLPDSGAEVGGELR